MSETYPAQVRTALTALYYATAVFLSIYLFQYYLSGEGGPTVLTVLLLPVCYILFIFESLRKNDLYPRLGLVPNLVIAAIQIGLALTVLYYVSTQFYAIRTVRAGFYNTTDLVMGSIMVALILEYTRKRYFIIFILNLALILYAAYGWLVPGMFSHPGMSWTRIISAMSLETATGVYSRLPQIALTLIGSFLLVLSVLRAFGCVDSILVGAGRVSSWSPYALPQAAVLGSFGVAMVSGSSAANAATTGSATIPAMVQSGMPKETAASIETASSLGGQLMPPIMGISAFLMADFLGRSYFDVVARGYAPALIYFISVAIAVYLLSIRFRPSRDVALPGQRFDKWDAVNIAAFAIVVVSLIALMGLWYVAPMIAALQVFMFTAPPLFVIHLARRWVSAGRPGFREMVAPLGRMVDIFASMTADLTLLLATISIMTGAFVITGIPTKVGGLLMDAAGVNLAAMIIVAFFFATLIGTGLPPAPTYILTALVIAPPIISTGVDPWVVHFFAFFLAVWGELTPPTSVVAAVTAKIADASFMATLMRALVLCVSLFMLMAGVFVRPELVLEPGLSQIGAMLLILSATIGVTFSLQARFADSQAMDWGVRVLLFVLSMIVLLYPDANIAAVVAIPVIAMVLGWFFVRRPIIEARANPAG